MKSIEEIKRMLKSQKPYLKARYGVVEIGVFGSFARNEQQTDSDIDVLVDFGEEPRIDLLDLVNLERFLSELLETRVDVAIKSCLRKRIGRRILEEVILV